MLPCPLCGVSQPDVGPLAAHLAEVHLLAPSEAMRRAREVREMTPNLPTPKEATKLMATNAEYTCSKCGTVGHNARSPECPQKGKPAMPKKACGYCKHTDHAYRDCPMAQARRKGKKRAPVTRKSPKASASPNGYAGTLATLRAEQAEITAAIAVLERLEARGR